MFTTSRAAGLRSLQTACATCVSRYPAWSPLRGYGGVVRPPLSGGPALAHRAAGAGGSHTAPLLEARRRQASGGGGGDGDDDEASPEAPVPPELRADITPEALSLLKSTVRHLKRECMSLRGAVSGVVALVDRAAHAEELKALEASLGGGGGLFLAETSADLARALQTPGARVMLVEGRAYVLDLYEPIRITGTTVAVMGNQATIVGSIAVSGGGVLDLADVFLVAPGKYSTLRELPPGAPAPQPQVVPREEVADRLNKAGTDFIPMPCVSLTQNSRAFLHGCVLVNGRDGLYAGLGSEAMLTDVAVRNCVRGVYEGVGCHVRCTRCSFSGNFYHQVLLGPGADARRPAEAARNDYEPRCSGGEDDVRPDGLYYDPALPLRLTRADFVMQQDPISDTYADCYGRDGAPVTLPPELSTAQLSDPVY